MTLASDEAFRFKFVDVSGKNGFSVINLIIGHHTVSGAVMFYGIFFWETVALDVLKVNSAEMHARIVAAGSHVILAGLKCL